MGDADNPQAGRADQAPRGLRLAHRDPVRGPVGTRRDLGAALIEAAYVMPVFFLLVFGIMEIGLYMNDDLTVCPNTRKVTRGAGGTEFVGVWIKYEHEWVTKIFADTSIITDSSVIRLEPRKA